MLEKTRMPIRKLISLIVFFTSLIATVIIIPLAINLFSDETIIQKKESKVLTTTYDLSRTVPEEWLKFEKYEKNGEKYATFIGFNLDVKDDHNLSITDWQLIGEGYTYFVGMSSGTGLSINGQSGISAYPTLKIPSKTSDGYTVTRVNKLAHRDAADGYDACDYTKYVSFITAVVIPETVTYIESYAFSNFNSLEYLKTPFLGNSKSSSKPLADMIATPSQDNKPLQYSNAVTNLVPLNADGENDYGVTTLALANDRVAPALELVEYTWYSGIDYATYDSKKVYYVPPRINHVEVTADVEDHDDYYLDYGFVDRTFFNYPYLNEIVIDDGIKTIDSYNLFCASGVVDVTLPKEISALGIGAFNQCELLETVTLPNNLQEISKEAFAGCTALTTINIPSTVHTFNDSCFENCSNLKDMKIYSGRDNDGNLSYVSSKSSGFNIPTATTKIGASAFANCKQFVLVNLSSGYDAASPSEVASSNLTSIGQGAFRGCIGLTTLIVPFVGSSVGNSNSKEAVIGYIFETTAIEGATMATQQFGSSSTTDVLKAPIPDNLTTIIVTGETYINKGAFQGIQNLQTLTISSATTAMSQGILAECPNFKKLVVPFSGSSASNQINPCWFFEYSTDDLTTNSPYYKVNTYYNVPKTFTSIEITNTPTIAGGLLHNLVYLEEVIFGKATTTFNANVFFNNNSLKKLVVPFVGWHNNIWDPRGWRNGWYVHEYGYDWWGVDKNVRNSLAWLFSTSKSSSSEYINYNFCSGWKEAYEARRHYIPNSLEEIEITNASVLGTWALRGFSSVKKITVSNSPSSIHYEAFGGCNTLEELDVPYLGYNTNSTGLNNAEYTLGYYFGTVTGNSYVAMHGYRVPYSLTKVRVRSGTTKIANYAFQNCSSLTSVELTGSIGEIGYACFQGCINLGHLTTPNAYYKAVPGYAFYNCQTLDSLYVDANNYFIPNTVVTIGDYAFAGTSVNSVDFTKYSTIGNYAFANCLQLQEVNVTSNVKKIGEGAFAGCSNISSASLTKGLVSKYLFKNCTSLTGLNLEGVTTDIPEGFFYGCTSLTTEGLTMPVGNKSIGKLAFFNCKSLTSFVLGSSTTTIGDGAFQNCSGLNMLRIPNSVAIIGSSGWYGCRDSFYFTVLQAEDDWPQGWSDGWPCDFPVIIEGDVDDTVFTYVYDSKVKGYLISGVTAGEQTLAGAIQLPTTHNGISVKGVIGAAFVNQPDIISFVIPSTYVLISRNYTVDGVNYTGSPFTTGKYVVIYIMDNLETAISKGWHNLADTEIVLTVDELNSDLRKEKDFSDNAVIYYGDYWTLERGSKSSSSVPTLLSSQLIYNVDDRNFVYDGTTNYERTILSITTKGIPVGSAGEVVLYSKTASSANDLADTEHGSVSNVFEKNSSLTIFDSVYSNNLIASENGAKLVLTPNANKIKKYNTEFTYSTTRNESYAPIYLTGTHTITYGISKKVFELFWTGSDTENYSLQNHAYDANQYTITFTKNNTYKDTTYIYGLGNNFYLTGKIGTVSANVKYNEVGEIIPYYAYTDSPDVIWINDWNIYDVNGRNVSENFEAQINYCEFTIVPRKVKIVWKETNLTQEIAGVKYPMFPYTGSIIYPYAQAVEIDSETTVWGDSNGLLKVTYFKDDTSLIEIKPTYNKDTGTQINSPNRVYAILNPEEARNFEIVTIDSYGTITKPMLDEAEIGQTATNGVIYDFHICKATVTITITNKNYEMDANETYWSVSDFTKNTKGTITVTGLGSGSIIEGTFKTIDEGDNYTAKLYTTAAEMFEWADLNNDGNSNDVHIYRMKNGDRVDEDDCYDFPINISASINVKYKQFDISFYIDYDENGTNTPITMGNKTVNGVSVLTYTYTTVGGEHTLSGLATNSSLTEEGIYKDTLVRTYGYHVNDVMESGLINPLTFDEAETNPGKLYEMYITYTRKNFETKTLHIYFYNRKSTVTFNSFDKEYDSEAVDPYSRIKNIAKNYPYEQSADGTGKAIDQYNSLTFDFYYKQTFNKDDIAALTKIAAPSAVNEKATSGGYVVVINCIETDYFDGLNNYIIYFEITRRAINIDLAEQGSYKNWDGEIYSFTPNSSIYSKNRGTNAAGDEIGDLLPGHTLTGTLHTVSANPNVYSSASDWKWNPAWGVHNTLSQDVSSCYKIVFKNSFEIKARQLSVVANNIDRAYGSNDQYNFTFTVTVTDADTGGTVIGGYTVYYSVYDPYTADSNPTLWKTTPYSFSRPDYTTIYYKVVAPNYQTVYGQGHVNITLGSINYTVGAYSGEWQNVEKYVNNVKRNVTQINYDGITHQFGVDEITPWFSNITYRWRKMGATSYSSRSSNAPSFTELGFYEVLITVRAKNSSYYNWNHEEDYYIVEVRLPGYGDGGKWGPIVITDQYESSVIAANNSSMANAYTVSTPYNIRALVDGTKYYAIKLSLTERFVSELVNNRCYTTNNSKVVPNAVIEYSRTGLESDWTTNYISFNTASPTDDDYAVYYRIRTYYNSDVDYRTFGYADYDDLGNPTDVNDLLFVTLRIKDPAEDGGFDTSDDDCFNIQVVDNNGNIISDPTNIVYDETTSYAVKVVIKDGSEYDAARANNTISYRLKTTDDWQEGLIYLQDPGTYTIYYKVIAEGFNPVGIDNENYVILEIKKPTPPGGGVGPSDDVLDTSATINVLSYDGTYDKEEHTVTIIKDIDAFRSLNNLSDDVDLTPRVYYSIDETSLISNAGWSETPITRINAGTTKVYVKIELGLYAPFYFERHITINQLQMEISVPSDLSVEYSGKKTEKIDDSDITIIEEPIRYFNGTSYTIIDSTNYNTINDANGNPYTSFAAFYLDALASDKIVSEIDVDDRDIDQYIKLDSLYDGTPTFKYYSTKVIDGVLQKNKLVSPILPGTYWVEITYPSTENIIGDTVESFLTVTPKTLHLTWNEEIPYDGDAHRPIVTITAEDLAEIDEEINIRVYSEVDGTEVEGVEYTEIGDYVYKVEIFEDGMDAYYKLECDEITMSIIKRNIAVIIEKNVPYSNGKAWYSNDTESGIDLNEYIISNDEKGLVDLLPGHTFDAVIYTDSYVRGTYLLYYGVDPETGDIIYWGDENTSAHANLDNLFVKFKKLDSGKKFDILDADGNSVANYYTIKFDFRIKIVYPSMNIAIKPRTIIYDGNPHSLDLDLNALPTPEGSTEATTDKYADAYIEYSKDGNDWYSARSFEGYTDACLDEKEPYDIYVRLTHPSYEEYYLKTTLTIVKTTLDIEIDPLEVEYDAEVHNVSYSIGNANVTEEPTAVLYYLTSDYSGSKVFEDIIENGEDSQYYELGITNPTEAGEYHAIVYYAPTRNWNASGDISLLTINKKKVNVTVPSQFYAVTDYNGDKFSVSLSGGTIDQTMLIDYNGLAYNHHVYNNSTNYLTIRTNSANVKYDINGNITEYRGSLGDFEFDPDASRILDKDNRNVSANYQPIVVGSNDVLVLINKIALNFTVEDLEREYDSYYDETLDTYLPLPAIPTIITPDVLNPKLYFDNVPYYKFFEVSLDSNGSPVIGNEINGAYPTDVGLYYVCVGFRDGTNFSAATISTATSGYVTITPKIVSIDWDNLEVVFNGEYQAPTASYLTALHETKVATVYFYENNDEKTGVINAGEYLAYAKATTDTNHQIDETTSTAIFKINAITYTIEFTANTISLEGYSKYFTEEDIDGILEGLSIRGIGGAAGTKGQIHQLADSSGSYVPGTYFGGDFETLYSVYKSIDDVEINVTKSVKINVDCMVVVETREIKYVSQDITLPYNEQGYTIYSSGALQITYPSVSVLTVLFNETGESKAYETVKTYYDCGEYEIYFTISGTGFSTQTGSVVITIEPAEPSFEFLTDLTRTYNGKPIDDSLIQTKGNFNKSINVTDNSDLIYTYYYSDESGSIIDNTPLCIKTNNESQGTLPIDAGYYALVVTSKADDLDITHNYKKLEAKLAFQIKPKTLKVTFNYDKEVSGPDELNTTWVEALNDVRATNATTDLGLKLNGLGESQDIFHFSVSMDGDKMYRGKYEFNEKFTYGDSANSSTTLASEDFEYLFGYDLIKGNSNEALKQTFILKYHLTNESRVSGSTIDTTANYTIDMSFTLYIHYPEIKYNLSIDDTAYNGKEHYSYVDVLTKSSGTTPLEVTVLYSASESDLLTGQNSYETNNIGYTSTNIKLTMINQINPGTLPVYLKISVAETGKYYEDSYDSIFIKVDPVERTFTNNISEHFAKEYDLYPVGTYNSTTGSYLPVYGTDYEFTYASAYQQQQDDYDASQIYIDFVDYNTNLTLEEAIDAGSYTYRLVIPASQSGFFARTVITGEFRIAKQNLYVINTDSNGYVTKEYNGSSAKYSISAENNHKIVDKNGNDVAFTVTGTLITNDRKIDIYSGSTSGDIDWISNYTILANTANGYTNVTKNYALSLAGKANDSSIPEFKIKIVPGTMRLNVPQNARVDYTYDGTNHVVPYKTYVELPTSGIVAKYSIQDVTSVDDLDKNLFSSTYPTIQDVKIKYTDDTKTTYDVVPYSLWIRLDAEDSTFATEYIRLDVYVNQATPELEILRPTEYEYTGLSVLQFNAATDIENSADSSNSTEYSWYWEQYIEDTNEWLNTSGSIPKEVGKYRLVVHWTPSQSIRYTGAEITHEFTIGAKHITYNWDSVEFVYNGKAQYPQLDLEETGLPETEINQLMVSYDYSPIGSTGDINSIKVGRYQIEATLLPVSTNSSFKASNYIIDGESKITYNIVSRKIVIYANEEIVYTGEQIPLVYNTGDIDDPSYSLDLANGYPFAEGHYTDSILMTTSSEPKENFYAYHVKASQLNSEFMWQNNSFDIYDENGTVVTSNYVVSYDVSVRIVLNEIACKYVYDSDTTLSQNFEYDGQEHYLTVVPQNQGVYNIYYSCGDVLNSPSVIKLIDAGQYEISYKIYRVDENGQEVLVKDGAQDLNIKPKETRILLKNSADLSKIYDGKDVANPDVTLDGLENIPVDLKWYYINVDNNKVTDKVRAVGNYQLVVEKDDTNENYNVEKLTVDFEITEREIIISYPETSMAYTGTWWKINLDTANDTNPVYKIRMSNDKSKAGLSSGHNLTASIRTAYTSAREEPYRSADEFVIVNNKIVDADGVDVTQNYVISYDLDVKISKAQIVLESTDLDIEVDYDGNPHSIEVEVIKPASDYTITYSTYDGEFSTTNPEFTTRCFVTVNYRVEADNYEPYEGSATIKINGVKNPAGGTGGGGEDDDDEDEPIDSHIQYETPYTYDGNPYPTPVYIVSSDNGSGYDASGQVVYYFPTSYTFSTDDEGRIVLSDSELNDDSLKTAPTEVGRYKFVIYIPANGNYVDYFTNAQTFRIIRRPIEVTWHDLELEYNYEEQAPYATYTTVDGTEVRVDVIDSGMQAVGEYNVSLGTTYTGYETYEITNNSEVFTITKKVIEDFVIMTDMEFEYSPIGEEIVIIRNNDGTLVTIDEDGYVRYVGQDAWDNEAYIIIVSTDRNADVVGSGEHTITVQLVDKENTKWASKGNADNASDDLVTAFSITPYTFEGIQHSNDTKLRYDWDKYVIIDTVENNYSSFSIEIRTNGDNGFYSFVKPSSPDSNVSSTGEIADYIYIYGNNDKLSSVSGSNAYIKITGINNFSFSLRLEYEIKEAKPDMFELVTGSKAKFVYIETLDQTTDKITYHKNDMSDEDPDCEIIYVKQEKDEDGNIISETEIRRDTNSQANIYLGHIYQDTFIFDLLSQIKNDMSCMRVFKYEVKETTDGLGNIIYEETYTLIDPNLLEDDDDPYDNYKTTRFGTGMKIVLYEDSTCTTEVDSIQGIVLGDLNGDGKINNTDGQILQSYLMTEITSASLGSFLYSGLVSTKDGEEIYVNNTDGQTLQSFLMDEDNSDFNLKYILDRETN